MNKKTNIIVVLIFAAIGLIVVSLALLGQRTNQTTNPAGNSPTNQSQNSTKTSGVTYNGQDGKTALELLQSVATIETSGDGEMAFVTSINGVKADPSANQFWAFYINGQSASVGAGSYITKNSDTISWKLDTF